MAATRYGRIVERIFAAHYRPGDRQVTFDRAEISAVAKELRIDEPKNLGDVVYSFRYRAVLPAAIAATAPRGEHWIIQPSGRAKYCFTLVREWTISPNPAYAQIKVPDATPGIIAKYAFGDEQALLTKLRDNRLIDIFTGVTCYSLQNHLRTTVPDIGQVETDEIYVGLDRQGTHYVIPVQAKGGKDRTSVVQIGQDISLCAVKFPTLVCRPVGAQFMGNDVIALFEFEAGREGIRVRAEKHYRLVLPDQITAEDLRLYRVPGVPH